MKSFGILQIHFLCVFSFSLTLCGNLFFVTFYAFTTFEGETLQPYSLSLPCAPSPFISPSLSFSLCLARTLTHRSRKSDWQMAKLMRRGNQYSPNRRRLQQKGIIPNVIVVVILVIVYVCVCCRVCFSVAVVVVTVVVRIYLHSFVFIWLYLPLRVASATADSFALG